MALPLGLFLIDNCINGKNLQLEVKLSEEKDVSHQDKLRIIQDLKQFLEPVREKLLQFEQELKDR